MNHTRHTPAFEAFRALHTRPYHAYAHAHLGHKHARDVVEQTFGILARHWTYVISLPSPARHAWHELVIATRSREHPLTIHADSPLHYDAVILSAAGCSLDETAQATGEEISKISSLFRGAPQIATVPW